MKKFVKFRRGSALVLVTVVMVLFFITGTAILTIALQSRLLAVNQKASLTARCAADAGLQNALFTMNQALTKSTLNDASLPSASNIALEPSSADESYSYTITGSWPKYSVTATGTSGLQSKSVYASLAPSGGLFLNVITTVDLLYMKNNGTITGSCGTLSGASDKFSIDKAHITGDAFVGYNGNIGDIKCTVDGRKYAQSSPTTLGTPQVPTAAQAANPNTNWNTPNNASLGTVGTTTYFRYTGLTINGTLTINGNVIMYVNGTVSSLGSGINVSDKSSLTLYVSGNFGPNGNGVDLTSVANDPTVLQIYGVGASAQTFTLGKNNGTICATIFAPKADVTIGKNNATFTGAIIANSFQAKNNLDVTYDARCANIAGLPGPSVQLGIRGFHD